MWNTTTVRNKTVRVCLSCNKVFVWDKWVDVNYIQQEQDKVIHDICNGCANKELEDCHATNSKTPFHK
jgi:hypothetical protein